jgi:peptidoglycan lytic transglycosylase B
MLPFRLSRRTVLVASLLASPLGGGTQAAAESGFYGFLAGVRRDAFARGIRPATIDIAFRYIQYLPHVIELDHRQPEHKMSFAEYFAKVVTRQRLDDARRHLVDNWGLLEQVRRYFNVQPRFIVALWGVESDFGRTMGSYPVPSALATLAYDGRRGSLFRAELLSALRILDQGNIGVDRMVGSWAGAMGQCQFMPSTFLRYAVDYDGDGRRDIWSDRADVLASIANFLSRLGWRDGESWGEEVLLPSGFDTRLTGLEKRRPLREWRRLGVETLDLRPLSARPGEASLILPGGGNGPALLVYDNFRTILKWNNSTYFAAAVGFLTDSMARG